VLSDLARYGQVKRPSLGVTTFAIGPDLAEQMGLPADYGLLSAGLRGGREEAYVGNTAILLGGDLIVAINGQQVADQQDVSIIMDKLHAGDVISVTIVRDRHQMTFKLQLSEARDANV
jgi:S1-C subfamily serine protease